MDYKKTIDVLEQSETFTGKNHCKFIKNKILGFPEASLDALFIERGYNGKGTIDLTVNLTQDDKIISLSKHYQDNGLDAKSKAAKKYERIKESFLKRYTNKMNAQGIGVNITRDNRTIELPIKDLLENFYDHLKENVLKLEEQK